MNDWEKINERLEGLAPYESISDLARELNMPRSTVSDALKRGDISEDLIIIERPGFEKFSFEESGNNATLKFKHGEPLTPAEALELAKIDTEIWEVSSQRINMWQVGAKSEKKDLEWTDGVLSGTVESDGKLVKTYLFQIELKLARKKRIAVAPVFQPINFSIVEKPKTVDFSGSGLSVLFITDPHFGFRRTSDGLKPIHNRGFLNSLLTIASHMTPNVIIWNGDALDMADWSSFDTEPELLNNTQLAGIELGWTLGQFRQFTNRQILIEGNHELRLKRALVKNLQAGYELKPIHELDGHPLLSVPRFLGLEKLETEWVGGYPNGFVKIGAAKFYHGNVVRKGSAKTISSVLGNATTDRFFGHIHRFELAQKYIEDSGRSIWVGSPGCACEKTRAPGSDINHNWQLGAFLIHIDQDNGQVQAVEHISAKHDGNVWFRGLRFQNKNYMDEFRDSLPTKFSKQF